MTFTAVYFPHSGYPDVEVDRVYEILSEVHREARRKNRRFVCAGDFNAVVGQRCDGDVVDVVGNHGLGVRNSRGSTMVTWASLEDLCIVNTHFRKRHEAQWTHKNGGRERQIDFVCIDKCMRKWVRNAEAGSDINVGNDHRNVKVEVVMEANRRKLRTPQKTKQVANARGWKPQDPKEYAKKLDR